MNNVNVKANNKTKNCNMCALEIDRNKAREGMMNVRKNVRNRMLKTIDIIPFYNNK